MVLLHNTPEIELIERMALTALTGGYATYENCYRPLADCHGLLVIGTGRCKDKSMEGLIRAASVALHNIFDMMKATKKVGATADELEVLKHLVSTAADFWRRRPSNELILSIQDLKKVRVKQYEELKHAHC